MAHVNEHFLKLKSSYLFSEIARRVRAFTEAHPDALQAQAEERIPVGA